MTNDAEKSSLLADYRESLSIAGISTRHHDSLICPLCWEETRLPELSIEHVIPSSVGGTSTVLTCQKCNNDDGSRLDAHLAAYQSSADALQGYGTIPSALLINGQRAMANLQLSASRMQWTLVDKATDPSMWSRIKSDFDSGAVERIDFQLKLGYAVDRFETAILRAAYLVMFEKFGYEYAQFDAVQSLRRRIRDPSLQFPCPGTLVLEFRDSKLPPEIQQHVLNGKFNDIPFCIVILRIKKITITYWGALMPLSNLSSQIFFETMRHCSEQLCGKIITLPITRSCL